MGARSEAQGTASGVLASSFPAFVLLQGALYAAYGTESPFLPSFLGERGSSGRSASCSRRAR